MWLWLQLLLWLWGSDRLLLVALGISPRRVLLAAGSEYYDSEYYD
jgi:hypothetical protein